MTTPTPPLEQHHLASLPKHETMTDTARLVSQITDAALTVIILIGKTPQWFRRGESFGGYSITPDNGLFSDSSSSEPLIVSDASTDPRFCDHPLVIGEPRIRFYVSIPLLGSERCILGSLLVMDTAPKGLSEEQQRGLQSLARLLVNGNTPSSVERPALDQAQDELHASEQRFRISVDAMEEGLALHDSSGKIVMCNRSAERILGMSAEQMMGRTSRDLRWRAVHEDGTEFPGDQLPTARALQEGEPQRSVVMGIHKPDGHLVWISVTATPLFHVDQAKPHGVVVTFTDITVLRETDQAMQQIFAKSEHLLAAIPSVLVAVDADGVITAWNSAAERVFGLTKGEMVGMNFKETALNWDWDRVSPALSECCETGTACRLEDVVYHRQDGSERLLGLNFSPLPRLTGQNEGFLLLAADITERRQAQDALHRSISLFKAQQEATEDGILVVDEKMKVSSYNRHFARLWNIPSALLEANEDRRVLDYALDSIANPEEFLQKIEHLYNSPDTICKDEVLLKDGRIFERYSGPVVSSEGDHYGRIWSFRDITERRRDEEELVRSAVQIAAQAAEREQLSRQIERLSLVSTKTTNAVIITDMHGRIEWVNDSFTRTTGYTSDEVLGRKPGDVLQGPATDHLTRARLSAAIHARQSFEGEIYNYHKQGHGYWVTLSLDPLFSHDGATLQGFIAIQTDVWTDRKRTEEETSRLVAIIESSHDAIISKNLDDTITSWNPGAEALYGYTAKEMIGKSIALLVPDDRMQELPSISKHYQRGEQLDSYETVRIGKDGNPIDVSITVSPIKDSQGRVIGASNISRNIMAQKRAEREMVEIQLEMKRHNWELAEARDAALTAARLKSEFLANMSHEIRTPMNGVLGMLDLLLDTALNEEQNFFAGTVKQCANSLMTVINDILDFSKIEAGKMTIEHIGFSLRDTLEDISDLLSPHAREKGIELFCDMPPLGLSIAAERLMGDPDRLRQIITNLLGNAVKFTAEGEVVVGASILWESPTEACWRISVRDTGIGIDPSRQAMIFESFTQADGSTTRRYGGTGLGLTISRQLTALMGGEIGVESEVGQGSTFWVEMTLDKQIDAVSKAELPTLAGLRVLLAGGRHAGRNRIGNWLTAWGAVVLDESEGRPKVQPDVVVLDADGIEEDSPILARLLNSAPPFFPIIRLNNSGIGPADKSLRPALRKPLRQSALYEALSNRSGTIRASRVMESGPCQGERSLPPVGQGKILLAEDNPVNQMVAQRLLARLGYGPESVTTVTTGRQALDAIRQSAFAIVLMDVQMPEMDGLEAVRTLRAQETGNHLPVIAMTAHAMAGDKERCLESGMTDYVSKPIDTEKLAEVIDRWMPQLRTDGEPEKIARDEHMTMFSQERIGIDLTVLAGVSGGDPEIESELAGEFNRSAPGMIARCGILLEAGDSMGLEHWAHTLKGSGQVFGAATFVSLCQRMEYLGRQGSLSEAMPLLKEIEREWAEIQKQLSRLTERERVG